jgi:hypothetical protein
VIYSTALSELLTSNGGVIGGEQRSQDEAVLA